eukprot:4336774-Pleurochrysis_carterae.AAC.3
MLLRRRERPRRQLEQDTASRLTYYHSAHVAGCHSVGPRATAGAGSCGRGPQRMVGVCSESRSGKRDSYVAKTETPVADATVLRRKEGCVSPRLSQGSFVALIHRLKGKLAVSCSESSLAYNPSRGEYPQRAAALGPLIRRHTHTTNYYSSSGARPTATRGPEVLEDTGPSTLLPVAATAVLRRMSLLSGTRIRSCRQKSGLERRAPAMPLGTIAVQTCIDS